MNKPIWKPVKGFEEGYEISNTGRVRSKITGIKKKFTKDTDYYRIVLFKNKKPHYFLAHRLIAENLIENPNCYTQVNHIDGNPYNNKLWNLEWCTPKQNIQHAFKLGKICRKSDRSGAAILSERECNLIRYFHAKYEEFNAQEVADFYGIHRNTVYKILNNETWS